MASELTKITIESENSLGSLPGYVSSGNHKAGVIVLQEWWGVNEQIKSLASRWFSDKFIALVPDLYRGKVATDHETAGHYMSDLNWKGAVQDIQGAINYLRAHGCEKVGVTGFCMGGALSIASSVLATNLSAAVPFYGIPNGELADPAKAKTPLQLHFGTADNIAGFSDSAAQDILEEKLKANSVVYEFYRYEGAGHAFSNESNKENYRKDYAEQAHQRAIQFFEKYLH